ncbi:PTS 2-O-a-mannosyl-D-glycerate transporter subunit IIABC [Vibrio parahaemolyticus]|uniref:PTS 2-O-a-mannosyl-D-glycerate transporter subunit IIABC n=1 Tax=Vibrio parahaemolyticus TaxID=670 RepID=UPI0011209009|nr:PTS 2-O-a-mannosyl-D-glycerate transporter subunit IIABC [Vibrio parahaemolyticus]MDA0386396.1 PTS 2-O-a-mannosyl-D-glycerate transporter subunit IIABC [Vibrio parahaemolyticus]MDA0390941.1 PTS 2-O-a-mannosyl-D-glycerate transporter subunit IIABC [Vibrio parahaemolyticus]MDA0396254.1 PTS 2-O-a-mannosyl-D-glycerate transporter subunit IIABC [Vibrio parahaemolyticus]MDA0400041.1 PTS 2-O-a-mannosyl-D-glycerate transporter subunit IIABC [Vibrio parahaemolyticus]TOK10880.1 PTS 2-O-a-mannosyl-D-g
MKLTSLTNPSLINLQTTFESRDAAIRALAEQLDQQGKLNSKEDYLQAVFAREEQGPTALGEGLAVPHGKTDAVKEAAFAVATLKQDLKWQGLDEDEDVNLIFLIAIPNAEAGSTHMHLLTELTTTLVDDDVREAVLNATTVEQIFSLLDGQSESEEKPDQLDINAPTIVCVTACPAGIAHTYMAAEYLEKTGKKLGLNVHVEKQGANGIEDRLTAEQLNRATAVVFAAEVAIKELERFDGIPRIEVPVSEPIRHSERILNEAVETGKNGRSAERTVATNDKPKKLPLKTELKQALLSGISYAVPLIVAGGTVLAIATLIAQYFNLQDVYAEQGSWLWMYRQLGGGLLGTLMVPVLAAYTAYSLADKPALGPGFAAGIAANLIGSGFLGGVVGGLLAGYIMRWVKENVRLSPAFNGFLTFYLYPVIGTLVAGSLMLFVVGKPVAWLNQGLTDWLNGMSGTNALLLGAIIGFFVSFDLGGPVNKAAYAFCLGAMANGVYGPYAIFGAVKMVSAFTVTASTMMTPRLFKEFEIEVGKSTWLLGLAGITEGAIPMAIQDPIRVIGSFLLGSVVTGAMVGAAGIGLSTPGAGIFSMFLLHDAELGGFMAAAIWFGSALIGAIISSITLIMWRTHAVKSGKFTTEAATQH